MDDKSIMIEATEMLERTEIEEIPAIQAVNQRVGDSLSRKRPREQTESKRVTNTQLAEAINGLTVSVRRVEGKLDELLTELRAAKRISEASTTLSLGHPRLLTSSQLLPTRTIMATDQSSRQTAGPSTSQDPLKSRAEGLF